MRNFISGLYHFIIELFMWMPCHPLRRCICRIFMKRFGKGSAIYRNVDIRTPKNITIGDFTIINKHCIIDGRGGLVIGNNVDIAQDVSIWTEQHDYNSDDYISVCKPVIIEDYVWIASKAIILPGVKIGEGAVVACGSIVTKNIDPFTVVAGIPAKTIARRKAKLLYMLGGRRDWFK